MVKRILLGVLVIGTLTACATSPTGRKQFIMVGDGQMNQMGVTAYAQMKQKQTLTQNPRERAYVNCIADAIISELGANQKNQWEVNVFKVDAPNAFALPGKKIGVNTGMFKVSDNQHQLAAVMGHEVGHVLSRHGAERVSIQMATQTGLQLGIILAGDQETAQKKQLLGLLGLGAQVGVALPFSRLHESEADAIGLQLMAKAGFDPRESVKLWENMKKASGGKAPPEFLSTHPANQTRINALNSNMQQAMKIYQQARAQGKSPQCYL